jgi:hypothetical protein
MAAAELIRGLPPQVVLDLRQVRAERGRLRRAEGVGQVLVDVGVDGDCAGKVAVATEVTRLTSPSSTKTRPPAPPALSAWLGAGIRLEQAELTPALAAALRHAASMHNPEFYERQRMRASTYNIPRFLHCYEETIDGGLILPRGMLEAVTSLAAQAGSRLNVTDDRSPGDSQDFACTATLTPVQRDAVTELARHDLGTLLAPPGRARR